MIKAIFFDAAGVLYTRGGPTEAFALQLLEGTGYRTQVDQRDLERQAGLRERANQGEVSHETYWDAFLEMRGVAEADVRRTMRKKIIDYSNAVLPVKGAREALQMLKQRGFQLGIITDTMYPMEWKMRRLERAGVREFIDIVACSTDLGVHKPDPAIYAYAVQQAHLAPEETAFVGHAAVELHGARAAGMRTIAVRADADAEAEYQCGEMDELPDVPLLAQAGGH